MCLMAVFHSQLQRLLLAVVVMTKKKIVMMTVRGVEMVAGGLVAVNIIKSEVVVAVVDADAELSSANAVEVER